MAEVLIDKKFFLHSRKPTYFFHMINTVFCNVMIKAFPPPNDNCFLINTKPLLPQKIQFFRKCLAPPEGVPPPPDLSILKSHMFIYYFEIDILGWNFIFWADVVEL